MMRYKYCWFCSSSVLNRTYMDVVMATSGILLTTIASVCFFFNQRIWYLYLFFFINWSRKHDNIPVIKVRFLQNAAQVLLVKDVSLNVLIRYLEKIAWEYVRAHQWSSVILYLVASNVSLSACVVVCFVEN